MTTQYSYEKITKVVERIADSIFLDPIFAGVAFRPKTPDNDPAIIVQYLATASEDEVSAYRAKVLALDLDGLSVEFEPGLHFVPLRST